MSSLQSAMQDFGRLCLNGMDAGKKEEILMVKYF